MEGTSDSSAFFFPPESMTAGQLAFSAAVYGYILSEASNLISDGSELLLLVPRLDKVVGSIVLPVLGAVPDGMMVLFSGCGTDAQQQVCVGVGALAGSTVMLLTLPWFVGVFCGRVNIVDGVATYRAPRGSTGEFHKVTPGLGVLATLKSTGVGISEELQSNAKIMLYSMFGFLVVQIPALVVGSSKPKQLSEDALRSRETGEANFEHYFALLGVIVCFIEWVWYLKIQWEGGRAEAHITSYHVEALRKGTLTLSAAMSQFRNDASLAAALGQEPGYSSEIPSNDEAIQRKVKRICQILAPFFAVYDLNGDNSIDYDEFRKIFKDIRCTVSSKQLKKIFQTAGVSNNKSISFEEFVSCIMSFAFYPETLTLKDGDDQPQKSSSKEAPARYRSETRVPDWTGGDAEEAEETSEMEEEDKEDMPEDLEDLDPDEQQRRILLRSFSKMGAGTALLLLFSDPMVNVMNEMGLRLNINPFYVSFLLAPIASNASELVSTYKYARRRTQVGINTALSVLEGAAVMNNTFVLGIFYALIFFKGLAWEFTAETVSIILIQVLIAAMVLTRKAMTLLESCFVLSFYIVAMALVAALNAIGID